MSLMRSTVAIESPVIIGISIRMDGIIKYPDAMRVKRCRGSLSPTKAAVVVTRRCATVLRVADYRVRACASEERRARAPLFAAMKIRQSLSLEEVAQVNLGDGVLPESDERNLRVRHVQRLAHLVFNRRRKILEVLER